MAGGILFFVLFVRACVRPETLTRYLAEYLTHFHHQTYVNDIALWDRDECIKFWGHKVKVQGYGGITYAGTVTEQVGGIQYSKSRVESRVSGLQTVNVI